jgi:hypothetical protein
MEMGTPYMRSACKHQALVRTSMCEPCWLDEVHSRYLEDGELRMA